MYVDDVNDVMVLVLILGPDWDRGEEDGGETTVGTVIRKHSNNTVSVSTVKKNTQTTLYL